MNFTAESWTALIKPDLSTFRPLTQEAASVAAIIKPHPNNSDEILLHIAYIVKTAKPPKHTSSNQNEKLLDIFSSTTLSSSSIRQRLRHCYLKQDILLPKNP